MLVARHGPQPFDVVAQLGLDAFFASGGRAGRGGDFVTSPELGGLFGACLANALDGWWRALDEPDPFVVVEGGAGVGALARSVIAAAPACAPALRWVLVERSAPLRAQAASAMVLEPPTQLLGGPGGRGPVVGALDELPSGPFVGVVLANELLDDLPPVVAERTTEGWREVRVDGRDGRLEEVLVPSADVAHAAERWAPEAPVGARVPLARAAARWVQQARGALEAGRVVCVDYGARTTAELAERGGWLRTYRAHGRGSGWLDDLGLQDITYDVPADQLRPDEVATQAEALRSWGIEPLVAEARAAWHARSAMDLAALKARSRVQEADALLDPEGLGAFLVMTWRA